ncbi:MAG: energy transducer TonB [Pyrinomonadaceae bacterium]
MITVTRQSLSAVSLVALVLMPIAIVGQVQKDEWAGGQPEYLARKAAIKKVIPTYPEEALRLGISGRVEVKIAISEEGRVLRIKVRPRTDRLLKAAIANAVKQWKFKPRPDHDGLGRPILSRLTFNFVSAEGRVELYIPGPGAPDTHHLGYHNFTKDRREWREWEEVESSQAPSQQNHR